MGLRMKKFNIIGVPWKIWFLRSGHEKPICLKRGLGQFPNLRRGLAKKRVWVFLRGTWYPNAYYDDKCVLWIFPKMHSETFCSKICWHNSAKASFFVSAVNCYCSYIFKGSNYRSSGPLFTIYLKNSYFDANISSYL